MTEKDKTKTIALIDPKAIYSLSEVVKKGLLGNGKSYFICQKIVERDSWQPKSKRVIDADIKGTNSKTLYFIKGQNLINYLRANG